MQDVGSGVEEMQTCHYLAFHRRRRPHSIAVFFRLGLPLQAGGGG